MNTQAVKLFGCIYDANGMHPDPEKESGAVQSMPVSTSAILTFPDICVWSFLHH